MLQASELEKTYGSRRVLRAVSLACGPGETAVVVGANGAGKSTLLRIIAGLMEADRGRVTLDGQPIAPGGTGARLRLGYLPDAADAFPNLTVAELAALTIALKRAEVPPTTVTALRDRLELGASFEQRLRALSLGQRKRAFLLSALLGDPWLLILDEPSNGLDPGGQALVVEIVRERRAAGLGTLIASNDAAFVRALEGRTHVLGDGLLEERHLPGHLGSGK